MNLHRFHPLTVLAALLLGAAPLQAAEYNYPDAWGPHGMSVVQESPSGLDLSFSLTAWELGDIELDGRGQKTVQIAGVILPNEAGAPNLPGTSRYFAVPNGASVSWRIVASRTERFSGIDLAPAPRIPLETETGLEYPRDESIYSRDELYPASPVVVSPVDEIRGVQAAVIGITPFQYNPVTQELVVWRDLRVEVTFEGGDGTFGEDRLRSRWWDPILRNLFVNSDELPDVDEWGRASLRTNQYDYIIICQDDPVFLAWADSLKTWRNEEGIYTGVVTTTEIGGNTTTAIEAFINDAYGWNNPPSAVLLMGDYGAGTSGIISPVYNSYCISDNLYADVTGNHLPDVALARLTARDDTELSEMIGKMLAYERNPPTDPGFYSNPIMAGGWQTERWFILCEEVIYGYMVNALGKTPVREYAIYSGTPGSVWSTATNTSTVVSYFGPSGLGYIPLTPQHLTDWGGNASRINADINAGAFILQHRDHGATSGWGEPAYSTSSLSGLNNDELTFVFSINCLTGQYNISGDCFAEGFHRHPKRALGIIAATEVSYSFVNDAYVWGIYDFMWPDFDPGHGVVGPVNARPCFASASGKYYLAASSWPYNTSNKEVTYHLFHHHGDAFLTVFTEIPQTLTVSHDPVLVAGIDYFTVTADNGSSIGLSADGEFLAVAEGTGAPVNIPIAPQNPGANFVVTVTKQDYYRYRQVVPVTPPTGPFVVYDSNVIDDPTGDNDATLDEGETVDLSVVLRNLGTEDAMRVSAHLTCDDTCLTVVEGFRGYPAIPAGGTGAPNNPFLVAVSGAAEDGHVAQLTISVNDGLAVRDSYFSLPIQAPAFQVTGVHVNDLAGGDGNGGANAGETVLLAVEIVNEGHSDAPAVQATLTSGDPNVVIVNGDGSCGEVPVAGEAMVATFEVEILASCPEPTTLPFQLDLSCGNGFATLVSFELPVGGWLDDMEVSRGWTVGAPGDAASTGIWERADPVGTSYNGHPIQMEDDHTAAPGTICFVTGNGVPGGAAGDNDVDGGKTTLLTPVFELEGALSAGISYWRWYSNSWGGDPDNDWWNVDVTNDGVNWVSLEHTMLTEASWTQHTFNLTDYITLTNQVQIRFVAEDALSGSLVEAGVDDFLLTAVRPVVTGVEELTESVPVELALGTNYPNPFAPETRIRFALPNAGRVELAVYDISGRKVATLVSGELEAGRHEVGWQGRDEAGQRVASGVYFSRLKAEGKVLTRKMLLLR